jgi:hypothetical protein
MADSVQNARRKITGRAPSTAARPQPQRTARPQPQQRSPRAASPRPAQPARRAESRPSRPSRPITSGVQQARTTLTGNTTESMTQRARQSRATRISAGRSSVYSYSDDAGSSETRVKFPSLSSHDAAGPKITSLMAEWLIACLLIVWSIFDGTKSYLDAMHDALWRLMGVSLLFFVMSLMMRGKSTGKVAVAFGAIIDLGLVLNLGKRGTFSSLANLFSGTGTGGITLDASEAQTQGVISPRPTYTESAETQPGNV